MKGSFTSRDSNAGRRRPGESGREDLDRGATAPECEGRNGHGERDRAPARRLSGSAAVEHAKAHLAELTGQPYEAVSALNRTRDGWRVVLEVLELERIPRTTDILASYAVELDQEGD